MSAMLTRPRDACERRHAPCICLHLITVKLAVDELQPTQSTIDEERACVWLRQHCCWQERTVHGRRLQRGRGAWRTQAEQVATWSLEVQVWLRTAWVVKLCACRSRPQACPIMACSLLTVLQERKPLSHRRRCPRPERSHRP